VSAQPITPRDGDIYMLPTGATGAVWSGFLAQEIVRYFDGFWYVLSHPEGTLIYVADENLYLCKSSLGWVGLDTLMRDIQNARYLGLGAIADDANPLVFKLNSALLTAKSGGEGGTGDLRLTLNREALGNTASILFKNNYVAQAEIGLLGNNNLCVKTKSEAGAWGEAIHVTPAGQIGLGTSTPAQKLEIAGSDIVVHAMTIGRGGGSQATNTAMP
jgi:hypothetical protein